MAKLNNSELQKKLISFIEDITIGQENVKPDTPLYDLGLDSLDYTNLCYQLENLGYDFDKALNYCLSNKNVTISSLAIYLDSLQHLILQKKRAALPQLSFFENSEKIISFLLRRFFCLLSQTFQFERFDANRKQSDQQPAETNCL